MSKKMLVASSTRASNNMLYPSISINLELQDIVDKLTIGRNSAPLQDKAASVFETARGLWSPTTVLRCLKVHHTSCKQIVLSAGEDQTPIILKMGHAGTFLKSARFAFLGAYSVGTGLEQASTEAARGKRYLDSYLYEFIATEALANIGSAVSLLVEEEAALREWKVGPFLSPGSVHGWELTEQPQLCKLLDLETAGIRCLDNGVLTPFNSLSFIIGIGPGYEHAKVGSPCEVCSRRENCDMKAGR